MKVNSSGIACAILAVACASLGCGNVEENNKMTEKLNKMGEARSAENILFYLGTSKAKNALKDNDAAALADAVAKLKELGEKGVIRLIQEANDKSKATEDRCAAIALLGELGATAKRAIPALETLTKESADPDLEKAATVALSKIRPKD